MRERGITMVELIAVVVLLGILALMLIPRFGTEILLRQKVAGVAHEVASDLRYARRLAVSGGPTGDAATYYWFLTTTSGSTVTFKVYENGKPNWPEKSTTVPGTDVVVTGSSGDFFSFATSGAPIPDGGGFTVRDQNWSNQWNVSVVKNTGKITLTKVK